MLTASQQQVEYDVIKQVLEGEGIFPITLQDCSLTLSQKSIKLFTDVWINLQ